jgi:hypothetical protein
MALLLIVTMGLVLHPVQVLGQSKTVSIVFTIAPPTPVANESIVFSFNASDVKGIVGAILIIPGASCSENVKSIATLTISPPQVSGSASLTEGLRAGQYSALAAVVTVNSNQSVTVIEPCLTFTVTPSPTTAEFPSAFLILLLTLIATGYMFRKKSNIESLDSNS